MLDIDTILAIIISFLIVLIVMPFVIPFLKYLKFGQVVRDDGPKTHRKKSGTPTMGGLVIGLSIIITSLIFYKKYPAIGAPLIATVAFGLIGFIDDFIKVVLKRSLGLRAREKLVLQFLISITFLYVIQKHLGSDVYLPIVNRYIDLKWAYVPVMSVLMVFTVNAVNLTDGLDGLASGVTMIVSLFLAIISIFSKNYDMAIFSGTIVGSCMGFLRYNAHPAVVFMGDTGSLMLGGSIFAIAVMLKQPVLVLIVGGLYIIEAISVILQVIYFKLTKKRIFRMAPLHHHFELLGWDEAKVVVVFWIFTILFCLLALAMIQLKI
ncbi:phospho-N-acetylmuramoyl-pentapeptide-transferase [Caldicellulosiruptor owensensis OL]|uniref:Phospho-N-acetylmuramoyl-pentapeptide-transferase n=1 Tax=Caldicellulosiruptor owensensis (strain ATCC 700167 / DSM 13100 / OL) TaxID=632518 RepID=E4Q529_CALOW|nr:phospho-N-acetylmuramoyl-pentapeptide-transferase [Caldicellulosiruptor owensensis]ADQ04196.1 phospho-N-acetylmuramoyl-pentapeptide-transferase [Caldicellulosiruptor owensensis OL]